MVAQTLLPLQFQRQAAAPIDKDMVFTTTAERNSYLTNPRRYAGMIVGDVEAGEIFILNSARDTWISVGGSSSPVDVQWNGDSVANNALTPLADAHQADDLFWLKVVYGNGLFVTIATGSDKAAVSSNNGDTWIEYTLPSSDQWQNLTFNGTYFVSIAFGTNKGIISTDGQNWTPIVVPSGNWVVLVSNPNTGRLVALNNLNSTIYSDDNGQNWSSGSLSSLGPWSHIAYGNGVFIGVKSGTDTFIKSTDGITWTTGVFPATGFWNDICFDGSGNFLAVQGGSSQQVAVSADNGSNWVMHTIGNDSGYSAIGAIEGSGMVLAVSSSSAKASYTYDSGLHWNEIDTTSNPSWCCVANSSDRFVFTSFTNVIGRFQFVLSAPVSVLNFEGTSIEKVSQIGGEVTIKVSAPAGSESVKSDIFQMVGNNAAPWDGTPLNSWSVASVYQESGDINITGGNTFEFLTPAWYKITINAWAQDVNVHWPNDPTLYGTSILRADGYHSQSVHSSTATPNPPQTWEVIANFNDVFEVREWTDIYFINATELPVDTAIFAFARKYLNDSQVNFNLFVEVTRLPGTLV